MKYIILKKIIILLIILSIVLTGVGSYLVNNNKNDYAAKVNGQKISRMSFERAFQNECIRQQKILGHQFSQLISDKGYIQQIRQKVFSQLINESLIEQYTKDLKLIISDEQIKRAIFNQPDFQSHEKFDNIRYLDFIRKIGLTANQYAEALRKKLVMQQLISSISETDFVLKREIDAMLALINQQRIVRQAVLNVSPLVKRQKVSEEEAKSYYDHHKNDFLKPEEFRVRYAKINEDSVKVIIGKTEIQNWYDKHKSDYVQPQRKHYSVIQLKSEEEAETMLEQLRNGSDFAALAKEKSIDPISRKKGGKMGWMELAVTPEELKNANLNDKGQLSNVIKSSVGFLVIRLDDIQPEKIKSLTEVYDSVFKKVKKEKIRNFYYKLEKRINNSFRYDSILNENGWLENDKKEIDFRMVETGWFSRDNIPSDLMFKSIKDAIFDKYSLHVEYFSKKCDLINVDSNHYFILCITGHNPELIRPFSDVKETVINILKQKKATQEAKSRVEKILCELEAGKKSVFTKDMKFSKAKTLMRNEQDAISQTVFSLPHPKPDKPVYGISEDMHGNVVLLALDKVKTGNISEEKKIAIVQILMQKNAQITFDSLVSNLRKKAKIKYSISI